MGSFFKKALGIFVEFDETANDGSVENTQEKSTVTFKTPANSSLPSSSFNQQDIEKFESHFDKLFEQSNMPGPDYYEFCKMLETLEAHIPDEKTRFSAVYASLSIQGLTKQKLLEAADYYKGVIATDKSRFEKAIDQKSATDLESRKKSAVELDKKIQDNSALIQKLTKEITEAQVKIGTLKEEIATEEKRLLSNKNAYTIACEAMLNKINVDIQKIQTNL